MIKIATLGSALCVTLIAVAMGLAAYRFFTDRPGERALRLVPANALLFLSVDLSPSASQALVFKKIDDALARNDMKGFVEKSFVDLFDQKNAVPELREITSRSGAFALLAPEGPDSKNSDPVVFFLTVTDPQRAVQALGKACRIKFYKGTRYYELKDQKMLMAVFGDQLVIAVDPKNIHAVAEVAAGEKPSATSAPEYAAARAKLDSDSNLMVFINPALLKNMDSKNQGLMKVADSVGWLALGVAVRDGGVSLSAQGTMDPSKFTALSTLADLKPLRSDLYKILPSGAYGAAAAAQEGSLMDFGFTAVKEIGDKNDLDRFQADLEKHLNLDMKKDIIGGLQGNAVVAFYPSEGHEVGGLDLLAIVDDQNGADPAKLADAVKDAVDKSYQEGGKEGPLMTKANDSAGTTWTLSQKVEDEMRKGLEDSLPDVLNGPLLYTDKTVVYATRGKTVFLSTSRKLMDRALNTYKTGSGSVADDVAIAQPGVIDGSQTVVILNLAKIAKGVEASLNVDKMEPSARDVVNGILGMFKGLDTPFYIKGSISSTSFSGGFFIPMDYDRLIDFIGSQVHKK